MTALFARDTLVELLGPGQYLWSRIIYVIDVSLRKKEEEERRKKRWLLLLFWLVETVPSRHRC